MGHAGHLIQLGDRMLPIRLAAIAALAVMSAAVAEGQTPDCAKLKDAQTVNKMDAAQILARFGDCPADLISSAVGSVYPDVERRFYAAGFETLLQRLNYGRLAKDGAPEDGAIREFQEQQGYPVTGRLTLRQMDELNKVLGKDFKPANIWLNGGTFPSDKEDKPLVSMIGRSVFVQGSWWLDGPDGIANPLNKSEYHCSLTEMNCQHAELFVHPFSADQLTVDLSMENLRISRVELPIIELVPYDDDLCRRPVTTINVDRKEVFQVVTQVKKCPIVEDLTAPRVARLRSAAWQSKEYREKAEADELARGSQRWRDFEKAAKAAGEAASKGR
jgi:hypothetical protein